MRISVIKLCLEKYDEHKGPFRTYLKEEPHIKDLRDFYNTHKGDGQDRSLSPEEHLIVSQSSLVFTDLLRSLGGKETLEYLDKEGQLNGGNLAYLERHPAYTASLSRLMVLVHQGMSPAEPTLGEVIDQINITELPEKLIDIQRLVGEKLLSPVILTLLIQCDSSSCLVDVLILLARHGLNKEENINYLPNKENLLALKNILEMLEKTDLKLMLQTNVAAVLRCGPNLGELNNVLAELMLAKQLKQINLTKIFEHGEVVTIGSRLSAVLRIFRQEDWDLEHNLEVILAVGRAGKDAADFVKNREIARLLGQGQIEQAFSPCPIKNLKKKENRC